jgi:hypothetical protein
MWSLQIKEEERKLKIFFQTGKRRNSFFFSLRQMMLREIQILKNVPRVKPGATAAMPALQLSSSRKSISSIAGPCRK